MRLVILTKAALKLCGHTDVALQQAPQQRILFLQREGGDKGLDIPPSRCLLAGLGGDLHQPAGWVS